MHPFQVQKYNEAIQSTRSSVRLPCLPTFNGMEPSTFGVLIGNTKEIWHHFIRDLQEKRDLEAYLESEKNPFDRFVSIKIENCVRDLDIKSKIRYSYDTKDKFVHFLLLSDVAGLAYLNTVCLQGFIDQSNKSRCAICAFTRNSGLGLRSELLSCLTSNFLQQTFKSLTKRVYLIRTLARKKS